jgi:proline iminopeptidase
MIWRKNLWVALIPMALGFLLSGECLAMTPGEEVSLWPEIEPYESDYLKVSDIHEIYYELCGNNEGKPVFVLHGGPGSGCSPFMRRFFNPDRFLIVLHDQRGAKRSRPYAEIEENTTQHLVEDIERLRKHLGLEKIILFGGSWGATLGLAYAETYPENVSGAVLRGVFTATKDEIDHFYHGGASRFFPDIYDRLLAELPDPDRRPLPAYLLELIQCDDPAERKKYSMAWARYETKIAVLEISDEEVDQIYEEYDPFSFALLENYYMANACFLEEGQLLRDTNKIRGIPFTIVNGRYDMVCPLRTAYVLHKKLPGSRLVIAESAGHWMGDRYVQQALLEAMKDFE